MAYLQLIGGGVHLWYCNMPPFVVFCIGSTTAQTTMIGSVSIIITNGTVGWRLRSYTEVEFKAMPINRVESSQILELLGAAHN